MNKDQYAAFKAAVAHHTQGLEFVSTGACSSCSECGPDEDCTDEERELAGEPFFSWSSCDCCGSTLGGNRHYAHGRDKDGRLIHLEVCEDCLMYLNCGQLDDTSMMEIQEG